MKDIEEEDIKIPPGVVDEDAYRLLIKKKNEMFTDPKRFYYAKSADNRKFDMLSIRSVLLDQCELYGVSQVEIDEMIVLAKEFASRRGKLNGLNYKAFRTSAFGGKGISLLDARKAEIIVLFGHYHTLTEVHKIISVDWGLDVSFETVSRFRTTNLEAIQAEQDKYIKDYTGLRLVHKRSRLDEYSHLYENRKIIYDVNKSREDYKLLLQTLEFIRKEIEGDRLTVEGNVELNIQQTVNIHIQQNLIKDLNIAQLVLARISNRLDIDPLYLISRLEKSFYSKFTGFALPDNDINNDKIIYPSNQLYDFNELKEKAEEAIVIDDKHEQEPIKEVNIIAGKNLLAALLAKKREIIQSEGKILEQNKKGKARKIRVKNKKLLK
jgi:hypothetical protein